MFCDKYYGDYGYYATRYPVEYDFAVKCSYKEAKVALADEHVSSWIKEILTDRIKNDLKDEKEKIESEEQKRVSDKRNLLNEHQNADVCIVNIALAIYNENSKKALCDKLPLDKCFDVAFEIYKKNFTL